MGEESYRPDVRRSLAARAKANAAAVLGALLAVVGLVGLGLAARSAVPPAFESLRQVSGYVVTVAALDFAGGGARVQIVVDQITRREILYVRAQGLVTVDGFRLTQLRPDDRVIAWVRDEGVLAGGRNDVWQLYLRKRPIFAYADMVAARQAQSRGLYPYWGALALTGLLVLGAVAWRGYRRRRASD